MIKALEVTPLNTSKKVYYKCDNCGHTWVRELKCIINVDRESGKIIEEEYRSEKCEECDELIKED